MPWIEPGSVACQGSTLPPGLSLWLHIFSLIIPPWHSGIRSIEVLMIQENLLLLSQKRKNDLPSFRVISGNIFVFVKLDLKV